MIEAELGAPRKVVEVNRPFEIGLDKELHAPQRRRREPAAEVRLPGGRRGRPAIFSAPGAAPARRAHAPETCHHRQIPGRVRLEQPATLFPQRLPDALDPLARMFGQFDARVRPPGRRRAHSRRAADVRCRRNGLRAGEGPPSTRRSTPALRRAASSCTASHRDRGRGSARRHRRRRSTPPGSGRPRRRSTRRTDRAAERQSRRPGRASVRRMLHTASSQTADRQHARSVHWLRSKIQQNTASAERRAVARMTIVSA